MKKIAAHGAAGRHENISVHEMEVQILEYMAGLGISPAKPQPLQMDGKVRRYRVEGDKAGSHNGYYCIYPDNWPAGYVGSWKHTGDPVKWRFDARALGEGTQKNLRTWAGSDECKRLQETRTKELERSRDEAADAAKALFCGAREAEPDHPYLKKKNVNAYGIRQIGGDLLIPLRDGKGRFRSLQRINADGEKLFHAGAAVAGSFFSIGADLKDGPVILCEGYATGATLHELTGHAVICAMNSGNLSVVAPVARKMYPKRKVLVAADNDVGTKGNPGVAAAKKAVKEAGLDGFFCPEFPEGADGSDWNDFAAAVGMDGAAEKIRRCVERECKTKPEKTPDKGVREFNAKDLMKMDFPPVKWAVEGFLPAGCSVLAGGPKVGKSILSLHLSLAVAVGGTALGKIPVERGSVAYLALEDQPWRLQERIMNSGISSDADLSKLTLVTEIPRQHEGGIDWLEAWLKGHPDARLVVIDTLQKFRKTYGAKGDRYGDDYEAVGNIKSLADRYAVPLLIIHHLKKAADDSDWLNEVSGTQGIAGSADTVLSLKRGRCQGIGVLRMTGRDIEEKELAMRLDGLGWRLEGDAGQFNITEEKRRILEHLKEAGRQTPKEIAETLGANLNTVKTRLRRMVGEGIIFSHGGSYYT